MFLHTSSFGWNTNEWLVGALLKQPQNNEPLLTLSLTFRKASQKAKDAVIIQWQFFVGKPGIYKESSLELLAHVLCFTPVLNFNDFCQHCPSCRGWLY